MGSDDAEHAHMPPSGRVEPDGASRSSGWSVVQTRRPAAVLVIPVSVVSADGRLLAIRTAVVISQDSQTATKIRWATPNRLSPRVGTRKKAAKAMSVHSALAAADDCQRGSLRKERLAAEQSQR
jgi:hypothetical protein